MKFEVRDFDPLDLKLFADRAAEEQVRGFLADVNHQSIAADGPAWMAFCDDEPLACGGFVECYGKRSRRATAWAILLPMPRRAVLWLVRAIREKIAAAPYTRIEAHVEWDNGPATRLAELAGFGVESVKRQWFPMGQDALEYVILKEAHP